MLRNFLLLVVFTILNLNSLFAQADSNSPRTEVEQINDHLYKITCIGNNVAHVLASVGTDGVFLVDAGFTGTSTELRDALVKLGGQPKYLFNTHPHLDHIGGNMAFGNSEIISQENTLKIMSGGLYLLYAIPEYAMPVKTFKDEMTIKINGETIKMIHMPASHTSGDAIAYFVESNVVAIGDLAFPDWYPFIDLANGGSLKNYAGNIQYFIDNFPPETQFIAGHSRTMTRDDMIKYKNMIDKTTQLVQDAINKGKSYDEMVAEDLFKDYESYNKGPFATIKKEYWIGTIYSCLSGDKVVGKPAVISDVIDAWLNGNIEASVNKYKEIKQNNPEDYDFNEAYLNAFGYYLMRRNKLDEAIVVFKLNVDENPESGNVYDSLGEALLKNGDNKSAIECYKKAVELDPSNENAKQILQQLKGN